jgi:glutathione S-transferase
MFRGAERLLAMQTPTLLLESTRHCGQTPRVLALLEELAVPYELRLREDGYFLKTYGRPGPRLIDGDLTLVESATMLRHCARSHADARLVPEKVRDLTRVDAWLECSGLLGFTVATLMGEEQQQGAERRPTRIAEQRVRIAAIVATIERALAESDGDWLLGDFSLADCAMASLPTLARFLDLTPWPRVLAYCQR